MISLTLPFPPTANNLFRNLKTGGRVKTGHYKAWLRDAGWLLQSQRPAKIQGPYHIKITAERPDRRARDLDNLSKGVSDLLKLHGVIRDDSDALSVKVEWSPSPPAKPVSVHVSLWAPIAEAA
jgi:crossover junction endodeoxyribonuclease RusA